MNEKIIKQIKQIKQIIPPTWAKFVKTGVHKERPPVQEDWWHIRSAAILLKINNFGPIGVNRLAKLYGGRKNRGHKPDAKRNGSRNIIRKCVQQLEQAEFIKINEGKKAGKVITKKGREFIKEAEK